VVVLVVVLVVPAFVRIAGAIVLTVVPVVAHHRRRGAHQLDLGVHSLSDCRQPAPRRGDPPNS